MSTGIDALARDVGRLEALRSVKDLQRFFVHCTQFGDWAAAAALFAGDARLLWGGETVQGRSAIAAWLLQRGGGRQGLAPGALHTELIDEPLVNLSPDGLSAQGRWMALALLGDGQGNARIEGGIYENTYALHGAQWRFSEVRFYPQYSGAYETGWSNHGGADLPLVPYHFGPHDTGVPIAPAVGEPPPSNASAAQLAQRIDALNAEDDVRNLQAIYGYYVDRCMWDDVVDLFCDDCVVEICGEGIYHGREGVRRAMARMGPAGLTHGRLNDRPQFDTIVQVQPGGAQAFSRGTELGMVGDTARGVARWEIDVFHNRFVKEAGVWKLKELRLFRVMTADYAQGWGHGGTTPPVGAPPPPPPLLHVGAGSAAAGNAPAPPLAELQRRLSRSYAYEGVANVSAAYGYYLDDYQWPEMAAIFAEHGNKQSPFAGYYLGRERIANAATAMWGTARAARSSISFHWRTQPVIHVAADGRSANLRTRLFQPRTGTTPDVLSPLGTYLGASFHGGMYPNDQAVLEGGVWRLWSLTIDEHYFTSVNWKGGWAGVKDANPAERPPPSVLVARYPPDILMTELGRRMAHFRGGTGETITWPGILPMWFHYCNPVSGREPQNFWPDCVPAALRPEARMTHHGYLTPMRGLEAGETIPPS